MGEKLVTVIMPTFNRGYVLKKAISSVLVQDYTNWELLIIDDGSTDNTCEIVKSFEDRRIKYIYCNINRGGNHARNIGLTKSQGEYISFLDSDNVWEPKFLSVLTEILDENLSDIVFCRYKLVEDGESSRLSPFPKDFESMDLDSKIRTLLAYSYIDTNTVCFRRTCYEEHGGFDENFRRFQDWDYFLSMVATKKYRLSGIPESLVTEYRQADSISNSSQLYTTSRVQFLHKHVSLYKHYCCLDDGVSDILNSALRHNGEKGLRLAYDMMKEFLSTDMLAAVMCHIIAIKDKSLKKNIGLIDALQNWLCMLEKNTGLPSNNLGLWIYNQGFHKIAIYGYGRLGALCCDMISKFTALHVEGIVDKYAVQPGNLKVPFYRDCIDVQNIDAVLITAISSYIEIKDEIKKKTQLPVIWIGDYIKRGL